MSLRAYYLPKSDSTNLLGSDSELQLVPIEYINKLRYDLFYVDGPDYEVNMRKVAKERGFPLTEDSIITWDFANPEESANVVSLETSLL